MSLLKYLLFGLSTWSIFADQLVTCQIVSLTPTRSNASLPSPRTHVGVAVDREGDNIYLFGGWTEGEDAKLFTDISKFNVENDTLSPVTKYPYPYLISRNNIVRSSEGKFAFFGFFDPYHSHVLVFDPSSDESVVETGMMEDIIVLSAPVVQGSQNWDALQFFGGASSNFQSSILRMNLNFLVPLWPGNNTLEGGEDYVYASWNKGREFVSLVSTQTDVWGNLILSLWKYHVSNTTQTFLVNLPSSTFLPAMASDGESLFLVCGSGPVYETGVVRVDLGTGQLSAYPLTSTLPLHDMAGVGMAYVPVPVDKLYLFGGSSVQDGGTDEIWSIDLTPLRE